MRQWRGSSRGLHALDHRKRTGGVPAWVAIGMIVLMVGTADGGESRSIEAALAAFQLADPELMIEITAAEPDVLSPVDVAWDEHGRMFVAEMRDYPTGPVGGTIRLLEDLDDDGRYEKATLYADQIPFPSSVLPWRGGLLVTAAPDILYFKDTDGDGRADERRVVLTGFAEGDQQLRVNGLTFGIDGWVYVANGRVGGSIRRPSDPESAGVSIARSDLRFDPDTGGFETLSGPSQFGLARDDWGDRFLSWNTNPIRHVVIEDRHFAAAPGLQGSSGIASIIPPEDQGRVFPIVPLPRRFNNESVEYFNATCGTTIYRGNGLPGLQGDVFICESLAGLVHHRTLKRDLATFVSERVEQGTEFLASSDPWFHPVNIESGPDGDLYVVDIARREIEHPDFIPRHLHDQIDFRAGEDMGRIWRIKRKDGVHVRQVMPGSFDPEGCVQLLRHPNAWQRDTAQRLLIERADFTWAKSIEDIAMRGSSGRIRLAALWTLAALARRDASKAVDWLPAPLLRAALDDKDAWVRRGAVRMLVERPGSPQDWTAQLMKLASDASLAVRLEVVLAASLLEKDARLKILEEAMRGGSDEWLRLALVIGAKDDAWDLAGAITASLAESGLSDGDSDTEEPDLGLIASLARSAGVLGDPRPASAFIGYCACDGVGVELQMALLSGWLEGIEQKGGSPKVLLEGVSAAAGDSEPGSSIGLPWFIRSAFELAASPEARPADRVRSIRVIALAPTGKAVDALLELLQASNPPEVRTEAARQLTVLADEAVVGRLIDGWDRLSTGIRRVLLTGLARQSATAGVLLDAAGTGRIPAIELRGAAGESLARHPDEAVRARAAVVFSAIGGRGEVVDRYRPALDLKGDSEKGAGHFARICISCHRMQGMGRTVGPDLSGIISRAKEMLLSDILDPGAEVSPDYVNHIVTTIDGEVITGLLVRESPAGVTLRQAEGVETTIPSSRVAEFRAGGVSLMPQGLEESLDQQAMADLLEFLHHGSRGALARELESLSKSGG